MISYLYFPLTRSAAFRKMAALSAKGSISHDLFASSAASIALETSSGLAFENLATTLACEAGLACVRVDEVRIYTMIRHR